jgi:hypothetical protein
MPVLGPDEEGVGHPQGVIRAIQHGKQLGGPLLGQESSGDFTGPLAESAGGTDLDERGVKLLGDVGQPAAREGKREGRGGVIGARDDVGRLGKHAERFVGPARGEEVVHAASQVLGAQARRQVRQGEG